MHAYVIRWLRKWKNIVMNFWGGNFLNFYSAQRHWPCVWFTIDQPRLPQTFTFMLKLICIDIPEIHLCWKFYEKYSLLLPQISLIYSWQMQIKDRENENEKIAFLCLKWPYFDIGSPSSPNGLNIGWTWIWALHFTSLSLQPSENVNGGPRTALFFGGA